VPLRICDNDDMRRIGQILLSAHERWRDFRLGIETWAYFPAAKLGLPPDSADYSPISYRVLDCMLKEVPEPLKNGALIDYGCGMGRVLVVASRSFRRVIGVELSEMMIEVARRNASKCKSPCEIVRVDASQYPVPDDTTVFFFFSPFVGETMRIVVANIVASLKRVPRPHLVLVFNRKFFEQAAAELCLPVTRLKWVHVSPSGSWATYRIG
jgi:SAM-dependent methyltransferase